MLVCCPRRASPFVRWAPPVSARGRQNVAEIPVRCSGRAPRRQGPCHGRRAIPGERHDVLPQVRLCPSRALREPLPGVRAGIRPEGSADIRSFAARLDSPMGAVCIDCRRLPGGRLPDCGGGCHRAVLLARSGGTVGDQGHRATGRPCPVGGAARSPGSANTRHRVHAAPWHDGGGSGRRPEPARGPGRLWRDFPDRRRPGVPGGITVARFHHFQRDSP